MFVTALVIAVIAVGAPLALAVWTLRGGAAVGGYAAFVGAAMAAVLAATAMRMPWAAAGVALWLLSGVAAVAGRQSERRARRIAAAAVAALPIVPIGVGAFWLLTIAWVLQTCSPGTDCL